MKILLNMCYSMDLNKAKSRSYPLGLLSLSAYIQERIKNVDIKIIDGLLALDDIDAYNPDIIGLSLLSPFYTLGCQTARIIHGKFPTVPIIFGGHHITYLPNHLPKECTAGVLGEGEEIFYQICNLVNSKERLIPDNLEKIKGLVYWGENGALKQSETNETLLSSDQIPLVNNYNLCTFKNNLLHNFHIIASRGCPYKCRFCSSSPFWKKVRYYTVNTVVDQIEYIVNNYHPGSINFYDDLMIANKQFLQNMHDSIIERKLHLKTSFSCWVAGKHFNNDVAILLKEMNVTMVSFGVESGSPLVYEYLKGTWNTPEKNESAIRLAHLFGFKINISVIVGAPPETVEDLKKSFKYVKSLPINSGSVGLLKPFPGTPLWDEAKNKHLVNDSMPDWSSIESDDILNANTLFLGEKTSRKQTYFYYKKIQKTLSKKTFLSVWKSRIIKLFFLRNWLLLINRYLMKKDTLKS